jgi:hypothetical protein
MLQKLRNSKPLSSAIVVGFGNELSFKSIYSFEMDNVTRIHKHKTPHRRHYVAEWADHRQVKKAAIARHLGINKGTVTNWFQGSVPSDKWIDPLAEFLGTTREGLFRDPHDDWFVQFFRNKSADERERAKQMLEAAFPKLKAS